VWGGFEANLQKAFNPVGHWDYSKMGQKKADLESLEKIRKEENRRRKNRSIRKRVGKNGKQRDKPRRLCEECFGREKKKKGGSN